MVSEKEFEDFLEHVGVKGMKWGVRRGSDGVRPIARTLNNSAFGRTAQKNVDRHNQRKFGTSKVLKKDVAKSDKYFKGREKAKAASAKNDANIKAARKRVQEGKNVAQRLLNRDSFGKFGGRKVLSLMNKGNSPEDIAMAARMTRGDKIVNALLGTATVGLYVGAATLYARNR